MTDSRTALEALDECDKVVSRLEKMCCAPGRSPQMKQLAGTLAIARTELAEPRDETVDVASVIRVLESAGSQLGRLQVGCCAPARMPLYSQALDTLMEMQRTVKSDDGMDH
jgi:hypothetical protein